MVASRRCARTALHEAAHWKLSEESLPPGTIVNGKEPGLWARYRWHVTAALGLIMLQTILINGLIFQRRRRRAAEASIRAKEGALRSATSKCGN